MTALCKTFQLSNFFPFPVFLVIFLHRDTSVVKVMAYYQQPIKEENCPLKNVVRFTYPMIKHTELPEHIQEEVLEIFINAYDNNTKTYKEIAKMIKDIFDEKYGKYWHVVIGEAFVFEVTNDKNCFILVYAGNFAISAWKCS